MFTTTLLYAGLLPLLTAAVLAAAAARLRMPPSAAWACSTAGGLVVGVVALKCHAGIGYALAAILQPREAADWLPAIALLACGMTVLLTAAPATWQSYIRGLAAVFTLAVPLRLLSGNARLAEEWTTWEKLACLALLAGALGVVWRLLAAGGAGRQSATRPLLVLIVTVVTAAVLALSAGVLVYGQTCVALAAALAGTAAAGALRAAGSGGAVSAGAENWLTIPGFSGAAAVITFSLGGLVILGRYFAALSTTSMVLLVAALVTAGGPLPAALHRHPPWLQNLIRLAACFLLLVVVLAASPWH